MRTTNTVDATELRHALAETLNRVAYGKERVVLKRHGKAIAALVPLEDLVSLSRQDEDADPWARYDPDALLAGVEAAGSLSEELADRLKEHVYQARAEGSRPPDRPRLWVDDRP